MAVLLLGLLLSSVALARQLALAALAGSADVPLAVGGDLLRQGDCLSSSDSDVLTLCGAGYARLADDPAQHDRAVTAARQVAARLVAEEPRSGVALALGAYAEALAPANDDRAVALLGRSYAAAPFLRKQGVWRLWYGAHHWDALDAATRQRLFDEAMWLQALGAVDRDNVQAALADTPPYVSVALRAPGRLGAELPDPDYR